MGCNQCFIDSAPELEVVITTYSFFFAVLLVLFFVLLFVATVSRPGGIPSYNPYQGTCNPTYDYP